MPRLRISEMVGRARHTVNQAISECVNPPQNAKPDDVQWKLAHALILAIEMEAVMDVAGDFHAFNRSILDIRDETLRKDGRPINYDATFRNRAYQRLKTSYDRMNGFQRELAARVKFQYGERGWTENLAIREFIDYAFEACAALETNYQEFQVARRKSGHPSPESVDTSVAMG